MQTNSIIFSIRPRHADNIFCGKKTVELRRVRPKKLRDGTIILVYVSSPQKALRGAFRVAHVIQKPVNELWEFVKDSASVSKKEYNEYFVGISEGVAIFISEVWCLHEPIKLNELKQLMEHFSPPQSFRYTKTEEIEIPVIYRMTNKNCNETK